MVKRLFSVAVRIFTVLKFRPFAFFILISLLSILSACGGGGGGEGDGGNDDASEVSLTKTAFSLSEVANGMGTITRQNALDILSALHAILEPGYHFLSDVGLFEAPLGLLNLNYPSLFREEIDCSSGSESVSGSLSLDVNSEGIIRILNCSNSFISNATGAIRYRTFGSYSSDPNNFRIELEVFDLAIETNSHSFTLSAKLTYSIGGGTVFNDIRVHYPSNGLVIGTDELSITRDLAASDYPYVGKVEGKFYYGNLGWFEVDYESANRTLIISGEGGTVLEAIAQTSPTDQMTGYQLTLPELTTGMGYPLDNDFPANLLLENPFRSQEPPQPRLTPPPEVDRLATLALDASASIDGNNDFLSHEWQHISGPLNCSHTLNQVSATEANFDSTCQGTHRVLLTSSDGFSTVDYEFDLVVIPLPAEIAPISTIEIAENESVDFQLGIVNNAEDGPFSFAIGFGPNGLTVDQSGRVSGVPLSYVKDAEQNFAFAVDVSNGRTSRAISDIRLNASQGFRHLQQGKIRDCSGAWSDIDGDSAPELLCSIANSYRLLNYKDGEFKNDYIEFNPPSDLRLLTWALQDINSDGLKEILLGYPDEIIVIDGVSKTIVSRQPAFWNSENDASGYQIKPIESGYPGIFVHYQGAFNDAFYLLSVSEPFTYQQYNLGNSFNGNESVRLVKNIDLDPEPEFYTSWTPGLIQYDLSDPPSTLPISFQDHFIKDFLSIADVDADGLDEYIKVTGNSNFVITSDQLEFEFYDPGTGVVLSTESVTIDIGPEGVFGTNVFFLDVDNDDAKELIIATQNYKIRIYNYSISGFTLVDEVLVDTFLFGARQSLDEMLYEDGESYRTYSVENGVTLTNRFAFNINLSSGPFLQTDDSVRIYGGAGISGLGVVKFDSIGEILDQTYYSNIPSASPIMETAYTGGMFDEVVSHDFNNGHAVYDLATEQALFTTTVNGVVISERPDLYFYGDLDGDNMEDLVSIGDEAGWIDPVMDEKVWSVGLGFQSAKLADIDLDGRDELLAAGRDKLYLYEYAGPGLAETASIPIDDQHTIQTNIVALQDVNADGVGEVVLLSRSLQCNSVDDGSTVSILSSTFEVLYTQNFDFCIEYIPTINSSTSKKNLIVSVGDVTAFDGIKNDSLSYFAEIDMIEGEMVWRSSPFLGEVSGTQIIQFADNPYSTKKASLFSIDGGEGFTIFE